MNRIFMLLAGLPLWLFAFVGCNAVGEKGGSLSVVYGVAMAAALLVLLGFCLSSLKKERWLMVLFVSVAVVNTGYFLISVSKTLNMALAANMLSYLGSVFLPLSILMVILKVTKTKHPKWLAKVLTVLATLVFAVAASPGYSDIYYKQVSLETANGVSFLVKEYGALHSLYLVYLLGYFAAMLAIVVYSLHKKKITVVSHSVVLALAVFVNLGVWLIEQLVRLDFEVLSVSYVISELFLLALYAVISEAEKLAQLVNQKETMVHTVSVKEMKTKKLTEEQLEMFKNGVEELTPTEKHIYLLYTQHKTTKEIMTELNIKENTLKFHNKNIYGKLGVSSRKQLMEVYSAVEKHNWL
ncbi:MAG: hypothetical protein IJB65_07075 [Clostridia bacterium]|nr:hypothetical protein [Clostridia bacterium]